MPWKTSHFPQFEAEFHIAFVLDGRFIVLAEHQSSPSPNLPLRFLEYIGARGIGFGFRNR